MLKTKIRNHSSRRSYGKKLTERPGQKQRAMERARVRKVKAVENVPPPKTKTPWRAPRSKPDPGTYAVRTFFQGGVGCGMLLFAFLLSPAIAVEGGLGLFLVFLIIGLLFMGSAVHSFLNSRGGW